jgi:hypothetical protein
MHEKVIVIDVILSTGGTQISLVEEVDIELIGIVSDVYQRPHSDIELALFVEQRFLNILLNNPLGVWGLFMYKINNISDLGE